MELASLSAKPQLMEVKIEDKATVKEFGEVITFFTWDRQPMDIFMKLAQADQKNFAGIIDIVRTLILDKEGNQILSDDKMLPTSLLMKAVGVITDKLGK